MKTGIATDAPETGRPLMAGKTVLVTGATGGIGKATAVGLARLGARVAITGRDMARAEAAAADIRAAANNAGGRRVRRGPLLADGGTPPGGRGARQVSAVGRAGEQRWRVLGAPALHRRRLGAHICAQPPRPLPPHQPAV